MHTLKKSLNTARNVNFANARSEQINYLNTATNNMAYYERNCTFVQEMHVMQEIGLKAN